MEDAKSNKKAGIWGPLIYEGFSLENNAVWFAGGRLEWLDIARIGKHIATPLSTEGYETQFVTGCCLIARREVWEQTNGFDERFFLYFEDIDLNIRAQKQGWVSRVVPQAVIWHNVSSTSISKLGSPGMLYYHHRNGMLLAQLRGPWWIKIYIHFWAIAKLMLQIIKLMLQKDIVQSHAIIRGITDYYRGNFGKLA